MGGKRLFILFALILFLLPFVSAAPPSQSTENADYLQILTPAFDTLEKGTNFTFWWHVYNSTDYISNATAECAFHLYNTYNVTDHLYVLDDAPFDTGTGRDFYAYVDGGNFSTVGEYRYLIECKTPKPKDVSWQVGGIEEAFMVTPTGKAIEDNSWAIIFGLSILMLALIYIANSFNTKQWMLKTGFIMFALMVGMVIAKTVMQLADYQPSLYSFTTLFGTMANMMVILFWIIITYLFIYLTIQVFKSFSTDKGGMNPKTGEF